MVKITVIKLEIVESAEAEEETVEDIVEDSDRNAGIQEPREAERMHSRSRTPYRDAVEIFLDQHVFKIGFRGR